jgi:hypothetical protein
MLPNNRNDYEAFLQECGLTQADMEAAKASVVYAPMDQHEGELIIIAQSEIQGLGVFARAPINQDQVIAPAKNANVWSLTGRFLNHSHNPNVKVVRIGGITLIAACVPIEAGTELTVNYRQVREVIK